MGKSYIDTVKYMVKADFEVNGIVEKPDIVGALFGQTEGLLGDDLDFRELQKNGRIGRIEVDSRVHKGRTTGSIAVPSSLDMVETSILAAALEIVDRVGPCDATVKVARIEDTRSLKRKVLVDRAKQLLSSLVHSEIPESKELSEIVRKDAKVSEIVSYGADKLPAGPEVAASDEVILVEGRADVANLLRNSIKNVVAIGGAKVGKTVSQLAREKEATAFLDGDRGGDIILRELVAATDIDFVARAPDGKEVEELTRKELIKALRSRTPITEAVSNLDNKREQRFERGGRNDYRDRSAYHYRGSQDEPRAEPIIVEPILPRQPDYSLEDQTSSEDQTKIGAGKSVLKGLEGSLKARFLAADGSTINEVPIREIMKALDVAEGVDIVVLDGIITQRLVDLSESKGVQCLVGVRAGNLSRKPAKPVIALAQ
ncbi:hypothetical protein COX85_02425 [Candidatus Micrarchaeota archaeon CG_4_10_14_0_2_um_filter_55_9]|nr:MAG: hypothetical protein COT57_00595 [Candidatus Micrarchaeota archaeon CG09_land_8_20_14_0_10_55_25]PIZ91707.1 MAG: hypothetical protein COX85_02425 [Candidatus Micrarchaeota archaeon CG_4_10_14_0_2_um_filter_55_9]PJD00926.1 MAG: hypothetical protein COU38_03745 [Candidatus Micrarchaeota archaeon CG10_big_fil_rev_8_21_14_0_10_54_18]